MKRTPTKMRKREREELQRLWFQLMRDVGADPVNPCEYRAGAVRLACLPDVPVFYARGPNGGRYVHAPPIGRAIDVFVPAASWIAEILRIVS